MIEENPEEYFSVHDDKYGKRNISVRDYLNATEKVNPYWLRWDLKMKLYDHDEMLKDCLTSSIFMQNVRKAILIRYKS